jgi:hypothetical protein
MPNGASWSTTLIWTLGASSGDNALWMKFNEELRGRKGRPIEEDFIRADALGHDPGVPRKFKVDGVEIETRMLHRRGIRQRDVKGADLLYEIAGRKFVLIPYKTPTRRDRVKRGTPSDRQASRRTFRLTRQKSFLMMLIHVPPLILAPVCRMKLFSRYSRVAGRGLGSRRWKWLICPGQRRKPTASFSESFSGEVSGGRSLLCLQPQ